MQLAFNIKRLLLPEELMQAFVLVGVSFNCIFLSTIPPEARENMSLPFMMFMFFFAFMTLHAIRRLAVYTTLLHLLSASAMVLALCVKGCYETEQKEVYSLKTKSRYKIERKTRRSEMFHLTSSTIHLTLWWAIISYMAFDLLF
ncbi:uncharacterized protein LOC131951201 [Physella acuta]|uniref:uncharacterized protein LOC131951201 n=1 Tax=Physella acuta TaxID=109671 RepID=UPI0027DE158B|nr:uncharacterized protein LOC131951201 [Physella acuta]